MRKIAFIWSILISITGFTQFRVQNPSHHFGDIYESAGKVKTTFILTNPFDTDTIQIKSIQSSCGCTVAFVKDSLILPHQQVEVRVEYDPTGRPGMFSKSVEIVSTKGQGVNGYLYLKVSGNTIEPINFEMPKNQVTTIPYMVADMYFYPISVYDTSYLDFHFIQDFINDLTYEIDYYQLAKVKVKVGVRSYQQIEPLTYLLRYTKYKLIKGLFKRGYSDYQISFLEPIFYESKSLPNWANAEIKVQSAWGNKDDVGPNEILIGQPTKRANQSHLVALKTNLSPTVDTILSLIDKNRMEYDITTDSVNQWMVNYKVPNRASESEIDGFKKEFEKGFIKWLKKEFHFKPTDSTVIWNERERHLGQQFVFTLDPLVQQNQKIYYEVATDDMIPPLLPTYKQTQSNASLLIDTTDADFKQMWEVLKQVNQNQMPTTLIIQSAISRKPSLNNTDFMYEARQKGQLVETLLATKYYQETGDSLSIQLKYSIVGPAYSLTDFKKSDYINSEFVSLIPVYNQNRQLIKKSLSPKPYAVNYDYYFVGVDTFSFVFKSFANYLISEIQNHGFVEMTAESSRSHVPVSANESNLKLAYNQLNESKKRLFDYLKKRLVDPQRIIFTEEHVLVKGVSYDKKTPIPAYRPYQYVTFVPLNYLNK